MRSSDLASIHFALALTVLLAASGCSSNDSSGTSVRAKGNVTVELRTSTSPTNASSCPYTGASIQGPEGAPTTTNFGGVVTNGVSGDGVTCTVTSSGAVDSRIESPEMFVEMRSDSLSSGALMAFYISGTGGTPDTITSMDSNNKAANSCTLTTSGANTLLTAKAGTIFAEYDCPSVGSSSNLSISCHASGLIYLTDCGS